MHLFQRILNEIVYHRNAAGKIAAQRSAASSLNLPAINDQATRQQMDLLVRELLKADDRDSAHRQLRTAVCEIEKRYLETHDGFAQAKGTRQQDQITVADMYAFSVAACYGFEALPPSAGPNGAKVALGVMTPARQDCGKNLIRLVWQGCGYEVIDLGANQQPQAWLKAIEQQRVAPLGLSRMKNASAPGLESLLESLITVLRSLAQ